MILFHQRLTDAALLAFVLFLRQAQNPVTDRCGQRLAGIGHSLQQFEHRGAVVAGERRILQFEAADVLCSDPYVQDDRLLPLDEVLERSDVIIIAAPHKRYRDLEVDVPVADIWNLLDDGVTI